MIMIINDNNYKAPPGRTKGGCRCGKWVPTKLFDDNDHDDHCHHHYNDHHQGGWDTLCPNPKIFIFWFFFPVLVISY